MEYLEEGDKCKECDGGLMELSEPENCSCYISPPCSACVDAPLECKVCGYREEIEIINDYRCSVDNKTKNYISWKPRELDKTKIDWHSKSHTHFSMIMEGVYPEGTTREDVLEKVRGTFGGRFEYFGNGKFKYIAYTD